jgi:glycosyltransferase involved in cell wall biosynthesis
MKVLQVIHGFPPYYMAGSEIYTHTLTTELAKRVDVSVFTRIENPYAPPYTFTEESLNGILVRRINKPLQDYTLLDKYIDNKIDDAFRKMVKETKPDLIHIGHLSHLSTNIVKIAKQEFSLPVVYTIHDFWLFCLRGQYIREDMSLCTGCNERNCYCCLKSRFKEHLTKKMIHKYYEHMKAIRKHIDLFLAPSEFLLNFFKANGVPESKMILSKYGFEKSQITFTKKRYFANSRISFGFLGRIIPVKGIKLLLDAFDDRLNEKSNLHIFGDGGRDFRYLNSAKRKNIIVKGGYDNGNIQQILDQIDVLVVPSLWYENSPLVIQEAFLAGKPVITADIGGMAELVEPGKDGFLFRAGKVRSLQAVMMRIVKDPTLLNRLSVDQGKVKSVKDEVDSLVAVYKRLAR